MVSIFYHKDDNDGVFSAAIAKYYLVNTMHIEESSIVLYPSDYDSLNNISDEQLKDILNNSKYVIMTDCSFNNIKRMRYFCSHENVYWFDHHKAIINESIKKHFDTANGIRTTECSAIMCVYKYFYDPIGEQLTHNEIPKELDILSAYDSFTFEKRGFTQDDCYNYNTYTNNEYNLDFNKVYRDINQFIFPDKQKEDMLVQGAIAAGNEYNTAYLNYITRIIEDSGDFSWTVDGRPTVAMFLQGNTGSLLFSKSEKCKSVSNAIVFKRIPNGNWGVSLYNLSREDKFDCGAYLKKYGGGGHIGAAGCNLPEAKFIKILKSKAL